MNPIGIMQGRLVPPENGRIQSFPRARYSDEFARAAEAGFDCIEWIDGLYGADVNPIRTEQGIAAMQSLIAASGVRVLSLCADIFMECPLVGCTDAERVERLKHLRLLLKHASMLGARHVMLPFVDNASLRAIGNTAPLVALLKEALSWVEQYNIGLHLETDLPPEEFRALLDALPHPLVRVAYDIGNSASLGYDPTEELAAYGESIGSVHIKDRTLGGGTVPLGEGAADFAAVFRGLRSVDYGGIFMLQVARGEPGDEVQWAGKNLAFVRSLLAHHGSIPLTINGFDAH